METYKDFSEAGSKVGERVTPHNIVVLDCDVRFDGDMSVKAFDLIRSAGLVTHSLVARRDFHCVSEDAALEVARILGENPVYTPEPVDPTRRHACPDCGRAMIREGSVYYCEHCEG